MKTLLPLFGICALTAACAGTGAVAPPTEMPSQTQTTGAPAPGDTSLPSDNKPIPPLNSGPTTNPPAAAMKNTTTQSAGDSPAPATTPAPTSP